MLLGVAMSGLVCLLLALATRRRLGRVTAFAGRRAPVVAGGDRLRDAGPGERGARGRVRRGPAQPSLLVGHRRAGAGGLLDLRERPAARSTPLLFVPSGALLVLAAARWRAGWVLVPLGLVGLAAYSAGDRGDPARAGPDRPRLRRHRRRRQRHRGGARRRRSGVVLALVLRPWRGRGRRSPTNLIRMTGPDTPTPRPNIARRSRRTSRASRRRPGPGMTSYKLSSNENPYPPLPGVVEAAQAAVGAMNRYPDMGSSRAVRRAGGAARRAGRRPGAGDRVGRR